MFEMHSITRNLKFLTYLILALQCPGLAAQSLPFTHYTPDREINPLPSAEVHSVYQDQIGYLWFSVYSSGLVRYNSSSMEVYGIQDGLRDLSVWEVSEDSKGRLWVTSNAGLVASEKPLTAYGTGESVNFVTEIDGIELFDRAINLNKISLDSQGRLWVGTDNLGIIRYSYSESGSFAADTISTGIPEKSENIPVRAVEAAGNGYVWVSLTGGVMLLYDKSGDYTTYEIEDSATINALYIDSEYNVMGGDQQGRLWFKKNNGSQTSFEIIDSTLSSSIIDITADSRGNIWVSSEGDGILKMSQKDDNLSSKEQIEILDGLLSNVVYKVFEDREKNIWIAQSGGASKLRYNYGAFKNLTSTSFSGEEPILPGSSVGSVHYAEISSFDCNFFAGTSEGGVACITNEYKSEAIDQEKGLPNNWVNGLESDDYGRIWIGTTRGLSSISSIEKPPLNDIVSTNEIQLFEQPAVLTNYNTASILAAERIKIRLEKSDQKTISSLWFPGYHEVYVVAEDMLFIIDESFGLPPVIYHSVIIDDEGFLWLGTRDRGIYRSIEPFSLQILKTATTTNEQLGLFEQVWSTENGAPNNQIEKMLWANDLVWVGNSAGLHALDPTTMEIKYLVNKEDGLPANNATSFEISPTSQNLWVGTNFGLAEVNPASGKVLRTVTRRDGLLDNEVWYYGSVDIDQNGIVYYGTAKGVAIYDPELDYRNIEPPMVIIERVVTEEEQGERNQYTFHYSALSFGNERGIRYQTRLLGFEDEWSSLRDLTRINYTNLPAVFLPKEYTFEVRAVNESNIASLSPATYSFFVSPPMLLEWWAFLLYAIIFIGGVWTVDRYQRKRLVQKEREKVREKELEQAKAIEEAYKKLEVTHQNLKAAQDQLVQQEKLASLGQLTAGIAHEIKNPLNFVNNFSDLSIELIEEAREEINELNKKFNTQNLELSDYLDDIENNLKTIHKHGTRADSIVKSMLEHSRGGTGAMEPTKLNSLVKEFVNLTFHGMRASKDAINVDIVYQLDESIGNVPLIAEDFSRVVINLTNNAFDAMREKLSTAKDQATDEYEPELTVRTKADSGEILIEIEDNGPGIPEEMKDKILQPFFTTKKGTQGTGLGLSITNDIIKAHGGNLSINTTPEKGSTFRISIPAE